MMINLNNALKFFAITILLQLFNISGANASTKYISIATGGITGVYYPAGGAVCRFVNRGRKDHGIRCSVESTGGSVANLNAIRKGFSDFGIVQSDWQYHAYNGTGFFSDQSSFKDLRAVFSLYTETFTLAVREGSGIDTVDDIPGKRVNFGPEGSGMHATMEVLSRVKGWTKAAFGAITNLDPVKQVQALCSNKIDVMIYMSGNPNGVLQEATQYQDPNCKVKILSIDKKSVNKLTKLNPFYVKAIVPGGMYRGNPNNIYTFGVKATFVTSNKTSEDVVYNVTKTVMQDFNNFKTLHPVFASLNKKRSIREGNSAPLHKGAIRYYKEAGLL
jgi:TRAP transporter TAXI family solute receptor